jgi:hypothetical protein
VTQECSDVIRIAPNELVFFTPQAFDDIYIIAQKNIELLPKTDFQNRGKIRDGISHRAVSKTHSPASNARSIRFMEPVVP